MCGRGQWKIFSADGYRKGGGCVDEGERIPIDISVPDETEAQELALITTEDGAISIDILARPCAEPDSQVDTIMVCAELDDATVARLEAGGAPHAIRIKLSERADATAMLQSSAGPMGGSDVHATIRLRLVF